MLTIKLNESEMQTVNYERFQYPCPIVQKRMHTLYLTNKNYPHKEIANILDIHINSVTNYLKMYQKGGIDHLKQVNYGTNTTALNAKQSSIEESFRQRSPLSVNEAIHRIEALTGIRRSPTRVRAFMKRIGMKCRKLAHLPAKADPQKQAEWLQTKLKFYIDQAQRGECYLFFMDAAHFVLQAFLCTVWSFARLFIKSPVGRQRLNVLGAVNAITKQLEFMTNTTYINAQVIADFFRQIAAKYTDLPIVIVLDNARYQHCQFIEDLAVQLGINLLFLPSYSPNLNIIERLWKYIKKKALYAQYYETFPKFKQAILETIHDINHNSSYIKDVNSLLTLKFQTFDNSRIYQV